jgi:hypothetical protein
MAVQNTIIFPLCSIVICRILKKTDRITAPGFVNPFTSRVVKVIDSF